MLDTGTSPGPAFRAQSAGRAYRSKDNRCVERASADDIATEQPADSCLPLASAIPFTPIISNGASHFANGAINKLQKETKQPRPSLRRLARIPLMARGDRDVDSGWRGTN
jgi:hypothetical protein